MPLTLARMPRDTERAVFEIGMNHAGEIEPLSRMVRPHAVVVTTVGPVHTENFPDGEAASPAPRPRSSRAWSPAASRCSTPTTRWFDLLAAEAAKAGAEVRTFGTGRGLRRPADRLPGPTAGAPWSRRGCTARRSDFPIAQTGLHWGLNSLAVLLMLEALDVAARRPAWRRWPASSRWRAAAPSGPSRLPGGAFTLIDESYNANPISMRAGHRHPRRARDAPGRRIVALTDMLELGAEAARLPRRAWPSRSDAADDRPGVLRRAADEIASGTPFRRLGAAATPRPRPSSRRRSPRP